VARGGTLVADVPPGEYDEHGHKLGAAGPAAALTLVSPGAAERDEQADPDLRFDGAALRPLEQVLEQARVLPEPQIRDETGARPINVARWTFRDGAVTILALQRDFDGSAGSSAQVLRITLARAAFVYDIRAKKSWGKTREFSIKLDAAAPALLALSPQPLPRPTLVLAPHARAGRPERMRFGVAENTPASFHVFHLDLFDATDTHVAARNVVVRGGLVAKDIPLPALAAPGPWRVRVTDVLSGQSVVSKFEVGGRANVRG
jgi:hypothetical protein